VYGNETNRLLTAVSQNTTKLDLHLLHIIEDLEFNMSVNHEELRLRNQITLADQLSLLIVEPLEVLSRSAHHYTDILDHLAKLTLSPIMNGTSINVTETEMKEKSLREDIIKIRTHITDQISFRIKTIRHYLNSTIHMQESDFGMNVSSNESASLVLLLRNQRRVSLATVLVQLLKRAAEAGNDLFVASQTLPDKLRAAENVLRYLDVRTHRKQICTHWSNMSLCE
jgi:hypothetical protein